jgi:hypothetical protein
LFFPHCSFVVNRLCWDAGRRCCIPFGMQAVLNADLFACAAVPSYLCQPLST